MNNWVMAAAPPRAAAAQAGGAGAGGQEEQELPAVVVEVEVQCHFTRLPPGPNDHKTKFQSRFCDIIITGGGFDRQQ